MLVSSAMNKYKQTLKKIPLRYLRNNAKGLLRITSVYGYPGVEGNILTWFGRNLNYEDEYKK